MQSIDETNESESKERTPKNAFQRFKTTRIWTAIEILSPVLAIVIPLTLYIYSEKTGQITVSGIQRTSLIDTRNEVGQNVTVLYGNSPIANLVSYTLEIANTGNTDIGKEDIYKLRWFAPGNSQILDARVVGKTGDYGDFISLDTSDPHSIGFNILTLNKGVSAKINILCSSNAFNLDDSTSKFDGVIRGASIVDNSKNFNTAQQPSFITTVFAGGLWTNVVKAVVFSLLTLIVILIIAIPMIKISDWRDSKKTKLVEDQEKQLVISMASGSADISQLDDTQKRWLGQTARFFSNLTQEQFNICKKLSYSETKPSLADLLLGSKLSPSERQVLSSTPEIEFFFREVLRFPILYKPRLVIDALINNGKFAG